MTALEYVNSTIEYIWFFFADFAPIYGKKLIVGRHLKENDMVYGENCVSSVVNGYHLAD